MAITKTVIMNNTDGATYATMDDWAAAYNPPGYNSQNPTNGVTRTYTLNENGSVTCVITFPDQATFDTWNSTASVWDSTNISKGIQE